MTDVSTTAPLDESAEGGLAQRVAAAALAVDGVHRVGSTLGLAVDRLRPAGAEAGASGVRLAAAETGDAARVTIVAEYPVDVRALADRVRRSASEVLGGAPVDVVVADVHGPFDRDPEQEVPGDATSTADRGPQQEVLVDGGGRSSDHRVGRHGADG